MAYDEGLAERIRQQLDPEHDVAEKKMFGGLCFMLNGHMSLGVVKDELMLRVGTERYADALAQPHAREMDFTKKPLKGFVYVSPDGIADDDALAGWIQRAIDFNATLPPK